MISNLINKINKKQVGNSVLSLLFECVDEYKITTIEELKNIILGEYMKQQNEIGQLYCIYNEMFQSDGKSTYRLGCAKNVIPSMFTHSQFYLKPSEIKHKSNPMEYHDIAKSILFSRLNEYLLVADKDFVVCDINLIKLTIDGIEDEISKTPIVDLIDKYNLDIPKLTPFKTHLNQLIIKFKDDLSHILTDK